MVTVATVGYGDIHPLTTTGKLLAMMLILGGVGSFTGLVANFTELLVSRRARLLRQQKQQVVTGVFYAELGTELLARFVAMDPRASEERGRLQISGHWRERDFVEAAAGVDGLGLGVDPAKADLVEMRAFLAAHSDLILRLLENPSLLEHESFTDLLRATFHLEDELSHRRDLTALDANDLAHLGLDMDRVYLMLVRHWLPYMRHLKKDYPYLFSLAVRINPFRDNARAEID